MTSAPSTAAGSVAGSARSAFTGRTFEAATRSAASGVRWYISRSSCPLDSRCRASTPPRLPAAPVIRMFTSSEAKPGEHGDVATLRCFHERPELQDQSLESRLLPAGVDESCNKRIAVQEDRLQSPGEAHFKKEPPVRPTPDHSSRRIGAAQ